MAVFDLTPSESAAWAGAAAAILILLIYIWIALENRKMARAAASQVSQTQDAVNTARDQARVSSRQAEIAEATFEAQQKPVLIDVPLDPSRTDEVRWRTADAQKIAKGEVRVIAAQDTGWLSLNIRNVGTGLAVIDSAGLRLPDPASGAFFTRRHLPPGEDMRVNFELEPGHVALENFREAVDQRGDLSVEVGYRDLAAHQTISRFDLRRQLVGGHWEVTNIEVTAAPPAEM
jgi:hypothetical protein